ncbi:hypothetical protein DFP72DRAFT_859529 [Ephemerocybe angulata]|uniref:Uncharacterized protein n=1 Tax=Ephemerocybe angulata TaxID=980116 RepID=A0A8H6LUZ3_9AGAR|nr:hypothetical protein DFP72DRAFT_859529 [Tulosesus angulatus]
MVKQYYVTSMIELQGLAGIFLEEIYKASYRKSVEEQIYVVGILTTIFEYAAEHKVGVSRELGPLITAAGKALRSHAQSGSQGGFFIDVKTDSPFCDYRVKTARDTVPITKSGPPIAAKRADSQSTTSKRKAADTDNDSGSNKVTLPRKEIANPLLQQSKKRKVGRQQLAITPHSHSRSDTPITTTSHQSLATGPPPSNAPSSTGTSVNLERSEHGHLKVQSDMGTKPAVVKGAAMVLVMGTANSGAKKGGTKAKGKGVAKQKLKPKSAETITDSDVEIIDEPTPRATRKPGTSTTAQSKPVYRKKPPTEPSPESPTAMDVDEDEPPLPQTRPRGRPTVARRASSRPATRASSRRRSMSQDSSHAPPPPRPTGPSTSEPGGDRAPKLNARTRASSRRRSISRDPTRPPPPPRPTAPSTSEPRGNWAPKFNARTRASSRRRSISRDPTRPPPPPRPTAPSTSESGGLRAAKLNARNALGELIGKNYHLTGKHRCITCQRLANPLCLSPPVDSAISAWACCRHPADPDFEGGVVEGSEGGAEVSGEEDGDVGRAEGEAEVSGEEDGDVGRAEGEAEVSGEEDGDVGRAEGGAEESSRSGSVHVKRDAKGHSQMDTKKTGTGGRVPEESQQGGPRTRSKRRRVLEGNDDADPSLDDVRIFHLPSTMSAIYTPDMTKKFPQVGSEVLIGKEPAILVSRGKEFELTHEQPYTAVAQLANKTAHLDSGLRETNSKIHALIHQAPAHRTPEAQQVIVGHILDLGRNIDALRDEAVNGEQVSAEIARQLVPIQAGLALRQDYSEGLLQALPPIQRDLQALRDDRDERSHGDTTGFIITSIDKMDGRLAVIEDIAEGVKSTSSRMDKLLSQIEDVSTAQLEFRITINQRLSAISSVLNTFVTNSLGHIQNQTQSLSEAFMTCGILQNPTMNPQYPGSPGNHPLNDIDLFHIPPGSMNPIPDQMSPSTNLTSRNAMNTDVSSTSLMPTGGFNQYGSDYINPSSASAGGVGSTYGGGSYSGGYPSTSSGSGRHIQQHPISGDRTMLGDTSVHSSSTASSSDSS